MLKRRVLLDRPGADWLQQIIDEVGSGDVGKRGSDL